MFAPSIATNFATYIANLRQAGTWAGEHELVALAAIYHVQLRVHTPAGVRLYGDGRRRMFHLLFEDGNHYNVFLPGPAANDMVLHTCDFKFPLSLQLTIICVCLFYDEII